MVVGVAVGGDCGGLPTCGNSHNHIPRAAAGSVMSACDTYMRTHICMLPVCLAPPTCYVSKGGVLALFAGFASMVDPTAMGASRALGGDEAHGHLTILATGSPSPRARAWQLLCNAILTGCQKSRPSKFVVNLLLRLVPTLPAYLDLTASGLNLGMPPSTTTVGVCAGKAPVSAAASAATPSTNVASP